MTRIERFLSLGATLVAAAATVWMVPEVRCHMGLDAASTCGSAADALPLLPKAESRLALSFVSTRDPRVLHIADVYRSIEARHEGATPADVPYASRNLGSATVALYRSGSGVEKIRLRQYTGSARISLLFYYSGDRLIFVHQVGAGSAGGEVQQRFYFHDGALIRWLGPNKEPIAEHAPEFRRNSEYLLQRSAELLSFARTG